MIEKLKKIKSDSLFTNSIYLILATGIVALFGFVFWTIIARQYSVETVGIATTLLSVSSLISLLSLAGFDVTLVRFLPRALRKNDHINTSLILVGGISIFLSEIFLLGFPFLSPHLDFVTKTWVFHISFIVFNLFTSWNVLTNSVFVAYRSASYILLVNTLFSLIKILLPLIYFNSNAMTIFIIAGLAQFSGVLFSFILMKQRLNYKPQFQIHNDIIHEVKQYSAAVYVASALNLLPPTVLPLIVTHVLGPSSSAYYYMAFTIASILYTVAYSVNQSLFAEGSHATGSFISSILKATKLLGILIIPSIVLLIFIAPFVLPIFGKSYSSAVGLLQLFAVSGLAVSIYSIINTILRTQKLLQSVIIVNAIYAVTIIFCGLLFTRTFGLVGIGWAWLVGTIFAGIIGTITLLKNHNGLKGNI